MASKSSKSDDEDLTPEYPNERTYLLQPWHHGEPTTSWWLNLDRAGFVAQAKAEQSRIATSSMARRITRRQGD